MHENKACGRGKGVDGVGHDHAGFDVEGLRGHGLDQAVNDVLDVTGNLRVLDHGQARAHQQIELAAQLGLVFYGETAQKPGRLGAGCKRELHGHKQHGHK